MSTKTRAADVVLHLTDEQVEELRRQLAGPADDWAEDPEIMRMLRRRERQVAREVRAGRFVTLAEMQSRHRHTRQHA